eukprot:XP_787925.3 PREDICTED: cleavage stimulation factor subunit 3 [Strongylocentrotus purpuratus]
MRSKNYERVEKLFQRCLMKVLNIDLWKCYLAYVKETKGSLSSYREKMAQAYDFALDKMGMDIFSYPIWNDYINFLKGVETWLRFEDFESTCGDLASIIKVEKRRQTIFKTEYKDRETSLLVDRYRYLDLFPCNPSELKALGYKEYEAITKGLNRNNPSVPPTGTAEEARQIELWKKYVNWEKQNPLRTEDQMLITKRVMFAFEQCLLCLGHHPDVWYEFALYLESASRIFTEKGDMNSGKVYSDEAAAVYERAISTIMKKNYLTYFAYADFEEGRMKYEKVHNIYSRMLAHEDVDPTLVYVQYMKFARRAEGIKAARTVFKKGREDPRSKYHVYVAAALMEYYCSKDSQVAFKIFELGLKKYGNVPEYILAYVDYLSHLNEDNNTRVLFERVLTSGSLPQEQSGETWLRFEDFESTCGDLASIIKVEKRRQTIFKTEYKDRETSLLVDRYRYLDLFPCNPSELKALGYKDLRQSNRALQILINPVHTEHSQGTEEGAEAAGESKQEEICRPSLDQMLPFRPRVAPMPGSHPVPGGEFPLPLSASMVLTKLPPPQSFQGPFVKVDDLMRLIAECRIPELSQESVPIPNGMDQDDSQGETDLKRKRGGGTGTASKQADEDSDDEDASHHAPRHDIYRSRQQKRVK